MDQISMSKTLVFFIFSVLTTAVTCHGSESMFDGGAPVDSVFTWYGTMLIAGALVVCAIILVMGCAELRNICARLCPNQTTFRDFDDDGYFNDISISAAPAVQFPMYPPVESTPESRYTPSSSVYFEPLPDILARRRNQSTTFSNAFQLRPKVCHAGLNRSESEEDGANESGFSSVDRSQELAKLEKLIINSRHQFPRTQLQYIKEMGSGWFGKVLEGEGQGILPGHRKTKVVVQMLKEDADQNDKLTFLQEGLPYKEIQDPNVVKLFCHCVETNPFLMIIEHCPTDLKTFMVNQRTVVDSVEKEQMILGFASDMARGLQALHQLNYIHRDFALRSCLVTVDRTVKIGDYGLSEEIFRDDYYYDDNGDAVPIRWLAPEVISFSGNIVKVKNITRDSNLWSYGVALWELVKCGTLPYADLSNDNVLRLVVVEKTVKLSRPDVAMSSADKLYELMRLCWSDSTERPSVRQLLIMLLHLQMRKTSSQAESSSSAEFDQKWNQLMPRPIASAETNYNRNAGERQSGGYAQSVVSNGTIQTITYSDGSDISGFHDVVARPTGFGSELSELNVSLLAEAGSLQASLQSAPDTPDTPPPSASSFGGVARTPSNELSLAAELGASAVSFGPDGEAEDEGDDDDGFEVLSRQSDEKVPPPPLGSDNAGFIGDKDGGGRGGGGGEGAGIVGGGSGGMIQLQAEVHKSGGDDTGFRLMEFLGNVNESFSVEFLSEEEDDRSTKTTPTDPGRNATEPERPRETFREDFGETPEDETPTTAQSLHRDGRRNTEELFDELLTSTPKVDDDGGRKPSMSSAYMISPDGSFVASVDDRSFMAPQKYTAYLQTVTTSMETDDAETTTTTSDPAVATSDPGGGDRPVGGDAELV